MKRSLLVFLAVSVLVFPVYAGLLEDVDKLTPEQAVEFQKKLQMKQFEAAPENISGAGFVQFIKPTAFNNAFPTVSPMTNLYGGVFEIKKKVAERILVGGKFGGAGNYVLSESSNNVYEDIFLGYGTAQFTVDYRIFENDMFILSTSPGVGIFLAGYQYTSTNDNTRSFYGTNRWGSGLCTSLSLDAIWKVYKEWGVGVGVSSFSGKAGGMRKIVSGVDKSAPDIDLTGTTLRISGSKFF